MDISALTLKLIIILIPGAIGALLFDSITTHKEWTPFKFVVNSIIMGIFAYLLLQVISDIPSFIHNICSTKKVVPEPLLIWGALSDSKSIPYWEVFWSSLLGIVVGGVATALYFYKFFNRMSKWLKISNKYGDENLYSYFLNAKNTRIVYVRSIKNNITYHGYVKAFSETDNFSELVMTDVSVYDYQASKKFYDVDQIYLSFVKTEVVIELANPKQVNGEENKPATS
jgi:small nuclear ribonucleoprotein (snRNP)-like protein